MADKKPEAGGGDNAPVKKKSKLLLFIVAGVLVLVLAGGGAAFFLMKKKPVADDEEGGDEPTAKVEKDKKGKKDHAEAPPVFVKLEPFTVKLQTEQQEAYLQAVPELRVIDMPVGDRVKQYTPEIRHKVLLLMSGKKSSDLSTPQGVQKLSNEMRLEINLILDGPKIKKAKGKSKVKEEPTGEPAEEVSADDSVQAVLFTSFIIQ